MPTPALVIDGLWKCLCPQFSARALRFNSTAKVVSKKKRWLPMSPSPDTTYDHLIQRPPPHRPAPVGRNVQNVFSAPKPEAIAPNRPKQLPPSSKAEAKEASYSPEERAERLEIRRRKIEEFAFKDFQDDPDSPKLALMSDEKLRQLLAYAGSHGWMPLTKSVIRILLRDRREPPALHHYMALIDCNASPAHGSAAEIGRLLTDMRRKGVAPSPKFYTTAFKALATHPDYIQITQLLTEMGERWFNISPEVHAHTIVSWIRSGMYEQALDHLAIMQEQNVDLAAWVYDVVIYSLLERNEVDLAAEILRRREMDKGHEDIWPPVWQHLLELASYNVNYDVTVFAWRRKVEPQFLVPSDGICEAVLQTACRAGDPQLATSVFKTLARRGTQFESHHYEALIDSYVHNGDIATALAILSIMQRSHNPSMGTTRAFFKYIRVSEQRAREAWMVIQQLHRRNEQLPIYATFTVAEAACALRLADLFSEIQGQISTLFPTLDEDAKRYWDDRIEELKKAYIDRELKSASGKGLAQATDPCVDLEPTAVAETSSTPA
ncbi:MAG: hypothetical protein M1814_001008 [Vezdaea aestivalis]|nr:MAG: hypothetical protein M1814_001008 [Vezdaea aestivalis]